MLLRVVITGVDSFYEALNGKARLARTRYGLDDTNSLSYIDKIIDSGQVGAALYWKVIVLFFVDKRLPKHR